MPEREPVGGFAEVGCDVLGGEGEGHVEEVERVGWSGDYL